MWENNVEDSQDIKVNTQTPSIGTYISGLLIVICFLVAGLVLARIILMDYDKTVSPDARLVELVQWTIGTVLAITLGLVGINWFGMSRTFDREISRITSMESSVSSQQTAATEMWEMIEDDKAQIQALKQKVEENYADLRTMQAEFEASVSDFYEAMIMDYARRMMLAGDAEDMLQVVLEFCSGVEATKSANDDIRQRILIGENEELLKDVADSPPLLGLNSAFSIGPYQKDTILKALNILEDARFPNTSTTTSLKRIAAAWGLI